MFDMHTFILLVQAHGGNAETSGLGDLFDNLVNHLTVTHLDFLKHWDRLIDLEARASQVYLVCYQCCGM